MELRFRFATSADAATLHRFICELATYEREPDAVKVTVEELRAQLEELEPAFRCVLAEDAGVSPAPPVGFALFFFNYSTWRGRPGIYLEDLFVPPGNRGHGVGEGLLSALARIAVERDCARVEWSVLEWNEAAIGFYKKLGAIPMSGWTTYRLTDEPLRALAERGPAVATP